MTYFPISKSVQLHYWASIENLKKKADESFFGKLNIVISLVHLYNYSMCAIGDSEKEGKTALFILCKLLSKKGVDDPLTHIYKDCKVTKCMQTVTSCINLHML